jgi:hypothetical protein
LFSRVSSGSNSLPQFLQTFFAPIEASYMNIEDGLIIRPSLQSDKKSPGVFLRGFIISPNLTCLRERLAQLAPLSTQEF